MLDYRLSDTELAELRQAHRQARDKRTAYRINAVRSYLETSRIERVFLPPYAPNLNLIKRLWKFFKKQILYNRYDETFEKFKQACQEFFANMSQYRDQLRSLLAENFQIIAC